MAFPYYYSRQRYRNAFENTRGADRVSFPCRVLSECFSPGSKGRDFNPPHPNPGFPQETPMKPSLIPKRCPLLPNPPRRPLPFHSPEWHHPHPWHPPRPPGHHYHPYHLSSGSVRSRDGENYHHYHRLRSHMSNGAVNRRPVSPPHQLRNNPHGSHYQDTTGQATHSHPKADQQEKGPDVELSSEKEDHPGQDANTGNLVDSSLAVPVVMLNKLLEQSVHCGSRKETAPLQRSDSWSPSSSLGQAPTSNQGRRASFPPSNLSTVTQNQPDQLTLSSETSLTKNAHHLLQKRHRESSSDDDDAKNQCLQPTGPDGSVYCTTASVASPHSLLQKQLHDLELSPKTSSDHSDTEPARLPSHGLKSCLKRTPMGAKQACIQSTVNNLVVLLSPPRRSEPSKPSPAHKTVSFNIPNMPDDPKSPSRVHQASDNKMVDSVIQKPVVKQSTNPSRYRKLHRNKKPVMPDDIQDLFTPDPTTYIVNSGHKTLKVWPDIKTKAITDKSSLSSVSSNLQTPDTDLCQKEKTATPASPTSNTKVKIPDYIKISLPSIILTRIPLPTTNTGTRNVDKQESVEKDVASPGTTSVSPSRTDRQSEDEDSLDLDLDLNFDLDLEVGSMRSSDSDDEQLVSLQEIMTKKDKPEKDTPERGAFSESSTPGHGQHNKQHHTVSSTKTGNYKNSLDNILKELNMSKKAKETETELLTACQEDLLRIAEYEEAESREEPISDEQQQFLQRFSLTSCAIRDVPPGHDVFDLDKFGRIFNQNTLQLRQCTVIPQNRAQKTLLWSSHAQFKLYVTIGLFQDAYNRSPCPFQITRFLFKMMSVHSDRLLSDQILQVLTDIAYNAAVQRVDRGNEKFKVWVPSMADITLVLMNMGASFVSLFPLKSLQPPFTERDLLDGVYIKNESPSNQEPRSFPEHNCTNIYKYLSCCLSLCPRFYSDTELLLLLTLLCTISLESRLLLHTNVGLYPVLYRLLKNIRRWDEMMPKMCQALTDLTDDHHNMCHLAKLLPHHSRGKKLRQHLSLSMISKLLDGSCLYTPKSKELQLCDLRPYLPRMKPSSLLETITGSSHQSHIEVEKDNTHLDQQAYYFCYSLLTLLNEATNYEFFPTDQKEQLLLLCSELERNVKCHIREGEKWLYRSKVKDLVARIYTKWQMKLQKTKPLNGQLYDYWQPLQGDVGSSQDIEEIESSQDAAGKDRVFDDDKEEAEAKMEVEEEEEETQNEHEEKESTLEDISLSDAADDEDPKEETFGELDTNDTEEGCTGEERAHGTFELDSERSTNTAQGELWEDMETGTGSPSVEALSPVCQGLSTSKGDTQTQA